MSNPKDVLYCSFCGASQHEVAKMIAGPTVFICDGCVAAAADVLAKQGIAPFGRITQELEAYARQAEHHQRAMRRANAKPG